MNDDSEHDETQELHQLHEAFGVAVEGLVIGSSPVADVMRDGAVRRTRRRLALTSGVAALAVLPVAAAAVVAGGHREAKGGAVSAATSPTSSGVHHPPPIVVPTPLPAPGQLNPALPNDSIVVLADGKLNGKHWRLVRDRYVVAGPEPANVMGDPSQRPHLPYAANWDKPGTIECDFTGIQWGDGAPADHSAGFLAGGGCNPTDDGSIAGIVTRFAGGTIPDGGSEPQYVEGRIDGQDAAYITVSIDGWDSGTQPVIEVPGERNDYYVVLVPHTAFPFKNLDVAVYDAHGRVLGTQRYYGTEGRGKGITVPSPTTGTSTKR